MIRILRSLLGLPKEESGDKASSSLAKSRLQFVLVQDRGGLGSGELANFKRELIQVVSKYFNVDERSFDVAYKRESDLTTLQINSTVLIRRDGERDEEDEVKNNDEEKILDNAEGA